MSSVAFAIRGVLAVVLGLTVAGLPVLAVLFPRTTTAVIVLFVATYVLVDGVVAIFSSFRSGGSRGWWPGIQGALGVCVGAVVLSGLASGDSTLLRLVGGWAIAAGAIELVVARDASRLNSRTALTVSGLAALLFGGATLVAWPGPGLAPFAWMLAAFTLVFGIARIVAGVRSA